jgi:hypothetical protein
VSLAKTDNMLLLRDLGSTNGTRVKRPTGPAGRRYWPTDQLQVASLRYKVQFVEDAFAAHAEEMTQQIDNSETTGKPWLRSRVAPLRDDQDSEPDLPVQVVRTNTPSRCDRGASRGKTINQLSKPRSSRLPA